MPLPIINKIALTLTAVFLVFYSAQKYLAAAPAGLNTGYILSVAIIVCLTAIIPLVAAGLISRSLPTGAPSIGAAAILPVVFAALGFTLYWAAYLQPSFGVPLDIVLPRALFPGLTLGALLAVLRLTATSAAQTRAPHAA
jgi:hypothetical protein